MPCGLNQAVNSCFFSTVQEDGTQKCIPDEMLFYVVIGRLEFKLHKHFLKVAIMSLAEVQRNKAVLV